MDLDQKIKLNELCTKAQQGALIELSELYFLPLNLDRDYYYKSLLRTALQYRQINNLDTVEIENILIGTEEKEKRIKELELELQKLKENI